MAGVNRRDAERTQVRDQRLQRVVRVNRTEFGLDRRGSLKHVLIVRLVLAVEHSREADRRSAIDKPRRDDRSLEEGVAFRHSNLRRGTDRLNHAVAIDEHNTVFDDGPGDRMHTLAEHSDLRRGRR